MSEATTDNDAIALKLAEALKREGDRESSFGFRLGGYWLPVAERILADNALMDAITAHRQAERQIEGIGELLNSDPRNPGHRNAEED